MALKGYHSYRGRQGVLRRLLVIVLLLVLIAACSFLFLQRYITYSDDGSFYLDLPFEINWDMPLLSGGDDPQKTDNENEQDFNLIVDRPEEELPENNEPEDEQQEENGEQGTVEELPPDEPYTSRRLIGLTVLPQNETELLQTLGTAGADGFVFQVKDREGHVFYQSGVADAKAVDDQAVSRELLTILCAQQGVYTVAHINCMRDPIYARANMQEAGICRSNGFVWYENDAGGHWLDAEKEAARRYLIDFAVECAQLGFDELLLENVSYPYRGKLYKIDYSANTMEKKDALILFLKELEAALEPFGVRISILLDEDTVRGLSGTTADTGFVAAEILPLVDAVYVSTTDAETVRREMKILLGGENVPALIPVVSEAAEDNGWYLVP